MMQRHRGLSPSLEGARGETTLSGQTLLLTRQLSVEGEEEGGVHPREEVMVVEEVVGLDGGVEPSQDTRYVVPRGLHLIHSARMTFLIWVWVVLQGGAVIHREGEEEEEEKEE